MYLSLQSGFRQIVLTALSRLQKAKNAASEIAMGDILKTYGGVDDTER